MNAIGLIITYKIPTTFNALRAYYLSIVFFLFFEVKKLDQVSFNLKVGSSLHSTIII